MPTDPRLAELIKMILRPRLDWTLVPPTRYPGGGGSISVSGSGTRTTCPNGHPVTIPATFNNVQISNANVNLRVTCPVCEVAFDAAPGPSVRVDTRPDGRLSVRQLVSAARDLRAVVKASSPAEREQMTAELRAHQLHRAADVTPAPERLLGPIAAWRAEHPQAAALLLDKGIDVLIALVVFWMGTQFGHDDSPQNAPAAPIVVEKVEISVDREPTDDELRRMLERLIEQAKEDQDHQDQDREEP